MYNKKAAMFGLDARIALAIFGALSVISGAALYSAIQESKTVALITKLKEVEKAMEQYYLDVGADFPTHKLSELVTSTEKGWNGPYINYPISTGNTDQLIFKDLPNTEMYNSVFSDETFPNIQDSVACSSSNNCYQWLSFAEPIAYNNIKSTWEELSLRIDGDKNLYTGIFRMRQHPAARYFYMRAKVIN